MVDFAHDAWSILLNGKWHAVSSTRFTPERYPEFTTACGEVILPERENRDEHRMPMCSDCLATEGPGLLPKQPEEKPAEYVLETKPWEQGQ